MDGSLFCKEQIGTIKREISVNLICRYLVISDVAVLTACIHHNLCSEYVCLKEDLRILNGTVNVRLSCKVNYNIWVLIFKDLIDGFSVCDVRLIELEVRIFHGICQSGHIACISKTVNADDLVVRILTKHMVNKITADKTRSACNDYIHSFVPYLTLLYAFIHQSRI